MIAQHLYETAPPSPDVVSKLAYESGPRSLKSDAQSAFLANDDFLRNPFFSTRMSGMGGVVARYHDIFISAFAKLPSDSSTDELATTFLSLTQDASKDKDLKPAFDDLRIVLVHSNTDFEPQYSLCVLGLYSIACAHGMQAAFDVIDLINASGRGQPALLEMLSGYLHLLEGNHSEALTHFRKSKYLSSINLICQMYIEKLEVIVEGRDAAAPLKDRFCSYPFSTLYTSAGGQTNHCCLSFSSVRAGSLDDVSFEDSWQSKSSLAFRKSILDGSFRYCDKANCSFILSGLPSREDAKLESPRLAKIIEQNISAVEPEGLEIVFEHDNSCNLACPSCRVELISHPKAATAAMDQKYYYLLDILKRSSKLVVAGNGDPFFSRHYRKILALINPTIAPNLKIDFVTNAMLFTPQTWESYSNLHTMMGGISISIDAATAKTYEKVRLLGNFSKLQANLEFISGLRKRDVFSFFIIQFVVQADNFREMEDFVEMGERLGVDGVIFQRIFPFGAYTDPEKFKAVDVLNPEHPDHAELQTILKSDRLKRNRVNFSTFQDIYTEHNPLDYCLDFVSSGPDISVHGWAYRIGTQDKNWTTYVILKAENGREYRFPTDLSRRPDLAVTLQNPVLEQSGFTFSLKGRPLPDGHYTVGLAIDANGETTTSFSHTTVEKNSYADSWATDGLQTIAHMLDIVQSDEHEIVVQGWAFIKEELSVGTTSLIFRNENSGDEASFPALQKIARPDVASSMGGGQLSESGFGFRLESDRLLPGLYSIGITIDNGNRCLTYFTTTTIDVVSKPINAASDLVAKDDQINYSLDLVSSGGGDISIHGWAYRAPAGDDKWQTYVVLKSEKDELYFFAANSSNRPDLADALNNPALAKSGFTFSLQGRRLPDGKYTVGLYIDASDKFASTFTDTAVEKKSLVGLQASALQSIEYNLDVVQCTEREIILHGWAFIKEGLAVGTTSIVFRNEISGKETSFTVDQKVHRPDIANAWEAHQLADAGFDFHLERGRLSPGTYSLGLKIENDSRSVTYFTLTSLDLKSSFPQLVAAE